MIKNPKYFSNCHVSTMATVNCDGKVIFAFIRINYKPSHWLLFDVDRLSNVTAEH